MFISIPSNNSDGNIEAADISIGSEAATVRADSAKKSGVPNVPGLDVITFSPDNKANLLRKNNTLFIRAPTKLGRGLVKSSPTPRSAYVNCFTVNVVVAVRCILKACSLAI